MNDDPDALDSQDAAQEVSAEPEKISGENPYQEYRDALDEHAWSLASDRERTKRLVDRAWDAFQQHVASIEGGKHSWPVVGDAVIIRGRIKSLDAGVALVEVYRSYPPGGTVAVQCGVLELVSDECRQCAASPGRCVQHVDGW